MNAAYMKRYTVKCKIPNCYHSAALYEGTAKEAARMHEMLGAEHKCELIPHK
jgi:hypothetical protein